MADQSDDTAEGKLARMTALNRAADRLAHLIVSALNHKDFGFALCVVETDATGEKRGSTVRASMGPRELAAMLRELAEVADSHAPARN